MLKCKYDEDKRIAIEFFELNRGMGDKFSLHIKNIYHHRMQTLEGVAFVKICFKHRLPIKWRFNRRDLLLLSLKRIEEKKLYYRNFQENPSDVEQLIQLRIVDDVKALLGDAPHPVVRLDPVKRQKFSPKVAVGLVEELVAQYGDPAQRLNVRIKFRVDLEKLEGISAAEGLFMEKVVSGFVKSYTSLKSLFSKQELSEKTVSMAKKYFVGNQTAATKIS